MTMGGIEKSAAVVKYNPHWWGLQFTKYFWNFYFYQPPPNVNHSSCVYLCECSEADINWKLYAKKRRLNRAFY